MESPNLNYTGGDFSTAINNVHKNVAIYIWKDYVSYS